jgi:DNA-directed RNA polymerase specialized sigma24 family protein
MTSVPVHWSTADDELLRDLARRGLSEGEIADRLKRNKSSVRTRAKRIDVAIARDRNGMQKRQKAESSL